MAEESAKNTEQVNLGGLLGALAGGYVLVH
jgi:expansin (peptidoglycan-binding protein)